MLFLGGSVRNSVGVGLLEVAAGGLAGVVDFVVEVVLEVEVEQLVDRPLRKSCLYMFGLLRMEGLDLGVVLLMIIGNGLTLSISARRIGGGLVGGSAPGLLLGECTVEFGKEKVF